MARAGVLLLAAGCGRGGHPGAAVGVLRGRVILPSKDTIRLAATAEGHPCERGRGPGLVLSGADSGDGVLLWARGAPLEGPEAAYPLLSRGDSTTARGVVVAVRFQSGEAARGLLLDSGTVMLTRRGDLVSARMRGSGLEPAAGVRAALDAAFEAVPLAADSASCHITL